MNKNSLKFLIVIAVVAILFSFFYFDLGHYLTLQFLKEKQAEFQGFYQTNPALTLGVFFITYVIVTAASLPGATILTLAGGALFGLVTGVIVVSFASTLGATLAFLSARFLFRDTVQKKFGDRLQVINDGIKKDGNFYLFTLRLVPAFPFFMVNLVMGLTPISTLGFYLVSQVGMLPGTAVYVNAGTQIAKIESASGILSFNLIISFIILGLFPLIVRKTVQFLKRHKNA